MGYIRVDEALPGGKKMMAIPKRQRMSALGAYVTLLSYCSIHLTDGFVPGEFAESVAPRSILDRLSFERLLEDVEGGYKVRNYLEWNRSKDEIEAIRQVRAKAGRKGGKARAKQVAKDLLNPSSTSSSSPTSTSKENGHFDAFWDEYGKKVGRRKAEKKFGLLSQRFELEEILRVARAYVEFTPDRRFRKDPTTFLNNFEDIRDDLPELEAMKSDDDGLSPDWMEKAL